MNRQITVNCGDRTYHGEIASIDSTSLGREDRGIMTAWLILSWPGAGVGFGGYAMDAYDKEADRRVGTKWGLEHVMELMHVVGVESWEKMQGEKVIVLFDSSNPLGSRAVGLANLMDEKLVYLPAKRAELAGGAA